jgi:hypothetical protein
MIGQSQVYRHKDLNVAEIEESLERAEMKKWLHLSAPWFWGGACFVLVGGMVACEKTQRQLALTVTPNEATVSAAEDQVLLTAALEGATPTSITNQPNEMMYPLVWSVANANHGRIVSSAGNTAVYRCVVTNKGNVVIVRDQAWREGQASIEWTD